MGHLQNQVSQRIHSVVQGPWRRKKRRKEPFLGLGPFLVGQPPNKKKVGKRTGATEPLRLGNSSWPRNSRRENSETSAPRSWGSGASPARGRPPPAAPRGSFGAATDGRELREPRTDMKNPWKEIRCHVKMPTNHHFIHGFQEVRSGFCPSTVGWLPVYDVHSKPKLSRETWGICPLYSG